MTPPSKDLTDCNDASLTLLPLHKHPKLLKQCCELINEEWPRSFTARLRSLSSSRDNLPTCLVLVNNETEVIGHCKLTPIPSIKESCFIESVVISKSLRGRGLGTILMKECEKYCRSVLALETIHLSTKGQEHFYEKLGYNFCQPITIYGSLSNYVKLDHDNIKNEVKNGYRKNGTNGIPPPPPPPLSNEISMSPIKSSKTFMVKSILL